jgi:hypothetical protein
MIPVMTWQEIVRDRPSDLAFELALERLVAARWFSQVSEPSDRDAKVERVSAWPEALGMFLATDGGLLAAPAAHLVRLLERHPRLQEASADAASDALDLVRVAPHIPLDFPLTISVALDDYVTEFIRLLVIEIYVGDLGRRRCTYFRDQLPWFAAGFLPCGWSGEWLVGRMRVF